jgi:hypothetical protein
LRPLRSTPYALGLRVARFPSPNAVAKGEQDYVRRDGEPLAVEVADSTTQAVGNARAASAAAHRRRVALALQAYVRSTLSAGWLFSGG